MAKDRFATNPFPDVQVSEDERQQLIALVDGFLEEYFHQYEDFVVVEQRKLDEKRWKHVKSRDNMHVYTERSASSEPKPSRATMSAPASDDLPVVRSVGTLVGGLDDLMFGVVNPTVDIMRVKASYVHDLDDAAVLCPVLEPTESDPFRSLIVKWMTIDLPLQSTSLVKARDFVYIEATGILHFTSGDRVGYHFLHSVEFPQTKPLPSTIRSKFSVFGFFRQAEHNVIDLFAGGTVDPGGDLMRFLLLPTAAEAFLSATSYVHCGQIKKLSWLLQRRHSSFQRRGYSLAPENCTSCARKTSGTIGGLGSSTCKLCFGCVCRRCKIRKRISFIALDGKLIQRKITFCTKCVSESTTCDALAAARDQASGYAAYNAFQSSSDTSEASYDE